jgi:energy-coupling factor transporter ATP-binding protein EcfA2
MAHRSRTPHEANRQGFPRSLLEQSASVRLDYFKQYTVAHPALAAADKAVWNALREPAGALLIFVVGPTGVGKTTLLAHLEKRLIEQALPRLEQDHCHVPVIRLDAVAPAAQQFRWVDYYQRALMVVREPLIDDKIDYQLRLPLFSEKSQMFVSPRTRSRANVDELRLAFEMALKQRKPRAVLIDEAEHMAKMTRGSKLLDQLDHLKSLAIMTQTVHVLVGTYDLMVFRNLSAQLSRRSIDVHFPRYRAQSKDELTAFRNVLWTFQRHLPLEEEPDLINQWKYCYERTIGCIGTLKDWLTRALAQTLETGEKTMTSALLEQQAWSIEQCDQMTTEALEGEAKVLSAADGASRLQRRLGLESARIGKAKHEHQQNNQAQEAETAVPGRSACVGQRKPNRDPVKGEPAERA